MLSGFSNPDFDEAGSGFGRRDHDHLPAQRRLHLQEPGPCTSPGSRYAAQQPACAADDQRGRLARRDAERRPRRVVGRPDHQLPVAPLHRQPGFHPGPPRGGSGGGGQQRIALRSSDATEATYTVQPSDYGSTPSSSRSARRTPRSQQLRTTVTTSYVVHAPPTNTVRPTVTDTNPAFIPGGHPVSGNILAAARGQLDKGHLRRFQLPVGSAATSNGAELQPDFGSNELDFLHGEAERHRKHHRDRCDRHQQ